MGFGAYLTLINATPYIWNNVYQHSYQLNSWDFPPSINPGEIYQSYIELSSSLFATASDDSGEVNFTVSDPHTSAFQIRLRGNSLVSADLSVIYSDLLSTPNNPPGSTLELGFAEDQAAPFMLSGYQANLASTNPPPDWMHVNIASLGCLTLNHLCIPGSHDAGMSSLNKPTPLVIPANTQTQHLDFEDQLLAGIRYFDVRPAIQAGVSTTGHYSQNGADALGATGQTIDSIIQQVNNFLGSHQELVILDLSHSSDTDNNFAMFTQSQWTTLFQQLQGLKYLYATSSDMADISQLQLSQFIADKPAVVIRVSDTLSNGQSVNLGSFHNKGFYNITQLNIYNSYADSVVADTMESDQLTKMKQQRPTPNKPPFLLSWTLTLPPLYPDSIEDLASSVYPDLWSAEKSGLWNSLSAETYPNIIMIDNVGSDRHLTSLAVAISQFYNPKCAAAPPQRRSTRLGHRHSQHEPARP